MRQIKVSKEKLWNKQNKKKRFKRDDKGQRMRQEGNEAMDYGVARQYKKGRVYNVKVGEKDKKKKKVNNNNEKKKQIRGIQNDEISNLLNSLVLLFSKKL